MDAAAVVSMAQSSAWANGDRTKATCSMPSMRRLPTYVPRPTRSSGSSTRRTALPRIEPGTAVLRRDDWQLGPAAQRRSDLEHCPVGVDLPDRVPLENLIDHDARLDTGEVRTE